MKLTEFQVKKTNKNKQRGIYVVNLTLAYRNHCSQAYKAFSGPATGGAEQDWSGSDEMQASQETLRRETKRPSQQHKHPRGKPGQQRAGASGELYGIF